MRAWIYWKRKDDRNQGQRIITEKGMQKNRVN
mgnify:FL=1